MTDTNAIGLNAGNASQLADQLNGLYQTLIELQRELLSVASDADDEGTASLASDYIREQEKTVWMLNAYLG